jgi:hypothetical protein
MKTNACDVQMLKLISLWLANSNVLVILDFIITFSRVCFPHSFIVTNLTMPHFAFPDSILISRLLMSVLE